VGVQGCPITEFGTLQEIRRDEMNFHNLTLILPQSQQTSNSEYILVGAIISAIITGYFLIYREVIKENREDYKMRVMAYSRLMGIRKVISQSNLSFYENFIDLRYYNCYSRIIPIEQLDYDELQRIGKSRDANALIETNKKFNEIREKSVSFKQGVIKKDKKYDNMLIQLNKTNERFLKTIGTIRIVFSKMEKLEDLVEQLLIEDKALDDFALAVGKSYSNFEKRLQAETGKITSNEGRNRVVIEMKNEINKLNEEQMVDIKRKIDVFDYKIEELLNYLKGGIKKKTRW
jgi:hypothetical protein